MSERRSPVGFDAERDLTILIMLGIVAAIGIGAWHQLQDRGSGLTEWLREHGFGAAADPLGQADLADVALITTGVLILAIAALARRHRRRAAATEDRSPV